MQKIALADKFFQTVRTGLKTATVRYRKRDYDLGEAEFYSDATDEIIPITITRITYMRFGNLCIADALMDGFHSTNELKNALLKFYPEAQENDVVTQVVFDAKGVIEC